MPKIEIYAKVRLDTHARLEELKEYLNAPSLTALIQVLLDEMILEMDKENAHTGSTAKSSKS